MLTTAYIIVAAVCGFALGYLFTATFHAFQLRNKDRDIARLKAQLAPFDHDGDGKVGGSRPRPHF